MNMKKNKKIEALKNTAEMWKWLAEHPLCSKRDYFNFKKISLADRPQCLCYCCQYALEKFVIANKVNIEDIKSMNKDICCFCPIPDWQGDEENNPSCEAHHSPYKIWLGTINDYEDGEEDVEKLKKFAKEAALDIVELASEQLTIISK